MSDTLRSIVEEMEKILARDLEACGAFVEAKSVGYFCRRLLVLLDAAEKTDLVQVVGLHEKSAILSVGNILTVWCNCERKFTSGFTEAPDAHEKWAAHRADELRDWLAARGEVSR